MKGSPVRVRASASDGPRRIRILAAVRGRRALVPIVAAPVCALAVGCGSDSEAGSPPETAAEASASTTLTAAQHSELERLYQAMVPLEGLSDQESPQAIRRLTAGMTRACRQ